jgi:hypothetical protein
MLKPAYNHHMSINPHVSTEMSLVATLGFSQVTVIIITYYTYVLEFLILRATRKIFHTVTQF